MRLEMSVEKVIDLPWFKELTGLIEADLKKSHEAVKSDGPRIIAGIKEIQSSMTGWTRTLSNPDLDPNVRAIIETEMATASRRLRDLENEKVALEYAATTSATIINPSEIVERLNKLSELLGSDNATRTNIELARHIEAIRCYPDGRVVIRSCKFGAFYIEDLENNAIAAEPAMCSADGMRKPRPRRRSIRRLISEDAGPELRELAEWATDIERFAGLDDSWFWEDEYRVPEPTCWSKDHASEVAKLRKDGMTHEQLCSHFGVTPPTIRKALRFALEIDPTLSGMPRKMARARWQDSHYEEVLEMKSQGMTVPELAKHFDVSEPLIYWALELAKSKGL